MKRKANITIFALSVWTVLSLSNCAQNPEKDTPSGQVIQTENTYKDTVHLATAINNIKNYVTNCDKYLNDTVPIRAYTLNRADLFGILGVTSVPDCKYDRCRVYIGMDSSNKFKLYMTPTVLKPVSRGSVDSVYVDTFLYDAIHKTYFVYDLNAPCPSTCDKTSKLYVK